MRLLVSLDGEKCWCIGNTVKALQQLIDKAKDKSSIKLLTVFYDSTKEKHRFKREMRKAGGDLIKAAQNYLNWWNIIQKRKEN